MHALTASPDSPLPHATCPQSKAQAHWSPYSCASIPCSLVTFHPAWNPVPAPFVLQVTPTHLSNLSLDVTVSEKSYQRPVPSVTHFSLHHSSFLLHWNIPVRLQTCLSVSHSVIHMLCGRCYCSAGDKALHLGSFYFQNQT